MSRSLKMAQRIPRVCSAASRVVRNSRPSRACARTCGFAIDLGSITLPTTRAARAIAYPFFTRRCTRSTIDFFGHATDTLYPAFESRFVCLERTKPRVIWLLRLWRLRIGEIDNFTHAQARRARRTTDDDRGGPT